MSAKEKLLLLWVFVVVVAGFAMTHFGSYLAFFIEHCFALILPTPRF